MKTVTSTELSQGYKAVLDAADKHIALGNNPSAIKAGKAEAQKLVNELTKGFFARAVETNMKTIQADAKRATSATFTKADLKAAESMVANAGRVKAAVKGLEKTYGLGMSCGKCTKTTTVGVSALAGVVGALSWTATKAAAVGGSIHNGATAVLNVPSTIGQTLANSTVAQKTVEFAYSAVEMYQNSNITAPAIEAVSSYSGAALSTVYSLITVTNAVVLGATIATIWAGNKAYNHYNAKPKPQQTA